jgi:hypothetical protein
MISKMDGTRKELKPAKFSVDQIDSINKKLDGLLDRLEVREGNQQKRFMN